MAHNIVSTAAKQGILLYLNERGELAFKAKKKGALTSDLKQQIVANKASLIQYLSGQHSTSTTGITPPEIAPVSRQHPLPLSFSQQRLWMLDQIDGGSSHYNMPMALALSGNLNKAALQKAFTTIIARHEVLRTCIGIDEQGEPYQNILSANAFVVHEENLVAEGTQELANLAQCEANRPFNLATDFMMRVTLVKQSDARHYLLLTLHHIASDGWSMGVLMQEFQTIYEAELQGVTPSLPTLSIQYADYASWQRNWLQGDVLASHSRYWSEKLNDLPVVHSLPLDKSRPLVQTFTGDTIQTRIDGATVAKLRQLCEQENASTFMALLATLSVLVARYSNEKDIVLGTPVANREQANVADLMGFFVNLLVVRTDLSTNPSFAELLRATRINLLNDYQHQQYPFEQLVDQILPQRSLSHSPLFQIMIVMQNDDDEQMQLPGLSVNSIDSQFAIAKYDLTLLATEKDDALVLDWEYNTDLFNPETIERFAAHFETLLGSFTHQAHRAVLATPMLTSSEYQQQVQAWNHTEVSYPDTLCIEQLFIAQVMKTPDAIAIVDEHGECTYLALYAAAVSVLERLQNMDGLTLQPEKLIAIRLPKGRQQVIATLAVMMAGCAYLPLECSWPIERCNVILQSASVELLIVQEAAQHSSAANVNHLMISDVAKSAMSREQLLASCREYSPRQRPTDLAYVIFTSGSTGTPKGVAVEHASVVNTLFDINHKFEVNHNDTVLAVSALSFDLSVYDFFGLLAVGGKIVIPEDARAKDPSHWLALVEKHQVNVWNTVPVSMVLLVEQLELMQRKAKSALKCVLMSGDWIPPTTPKRIWDAFGQCQVYSLGGATEGSIWSIYHPILSDTSELTSIPYGKPLGNQAFYILNEHAEHCPIGVTGELHIGGAGVVREYLNNPQQTQSHFVWHQELQQKLYRTGDLGRYLPDGKIEFCGRTDNQLKIRGFRVELGEIEKTLLAHDSVKKALVIAFDSEDFGKQIGAYVVLDESVASQSLMTQSLHEHLMKHLPYYMQPRGILVLDSIPLTPNGKVDRKSLPAIDSDAISACYEAPISDMEKLVCNNWQQVLKQEKISRHDNFFTLGGHSLLAARCVALINKNAQVNLNLGDLFHYPTVSLLSAFIDKQKVSIEGESRQHSPCVLPLNDSQQAQKLFFIHPGAGVAFSYRELAEQLTDYAQCIGLHSPLIFEGQASTIKSFEQLIDVYCQHIQDYQSRGPYYVFGYSSGGVIAHEVAHRLQLQGHAVQVGLIDSFATLDDYDHLSGAWYSPIQQALQDILLIDVAFDWQQLEDAQTEQQKYQGIARLAEAIDQQEASPYMPGASASDVIHFLMHFYYQQQLKAGNDITCAALNCTLFKAKQHSAFNQAFNAVLGWDAFNSRGVHVQEINTQHASMLDSPAVDDLSAAIINTLTVDPTITIEPRCNTNNERSEDPRKSSTGGSN